MSAATDVITAPAARVPVPAPADRILGRPWTPEQLHALAEKDRQVQRHVEYARARMALAAHAPFIDAAGVRAMVTRTLRTTAGTYWIIAALHLAQLALACPHLLTPLQRDLLLAPLEAAEALAAA